jgi:hypothetical protein
MLVKESVELKIEKIFKPKEIPTIGTRRGF